LCTVRTSYKLDARFRVSNVNEIKEEKTYMRKLAILSAAGVCLALAPFANAADSFVVHPSIFVGKSGDCGTGYAAGSRIVTSAWLTGMGLPDNGGLNSNATNPADNPNKQDPHEGLLLSKNGPTPDCSSAGAKITGADGNTVTELGFDIRNGTHCGGGAPRFNVTTTDGVFHFVGNCTLGTTSPAPQDPSAWTRVRFSPAVAIPPITPAETIKAIEIVFDEGTDAGPGAGLAVIDNIDISGVLAVKGPGGGQGGQ
jgi:hypothetical protein